MPLDKAWRRHQYDAVFPKFVLRVGVGLAVLVVVRAHAAPAPVDTNALLKELQAIETKHKAGSLQRLGTLAQQFMDASKSEPTAERIYIEARRETEFAGPQAGRFGEWRRNNKDLFDNDEVSKALAMHLRYLALTLAAAAKPENPPPIKELIEYVKILQGVQDMHQGQNDRLRGMFEEFYRRPVGEGTVAKANVLSAVIQGYCSSNGWEPEAGNWRSILEKNVRQPLRKLKDPLLLDTWQIEIDAKKAEIGGIRGEAEKFAATQIDLPKLMWAQAKDMAVIGKKAEATNAMLQLVRTYPQHPDIPGWVAELSTLLKEDAATPAAPVETAAPSAQ